MPATTRKTSKPAQPAEKAAEPTTPAAPRKPRTRRLASAVADGTASLYLRRSSGRERHVPYIAKADRAPLLAMRRDQANGPLPLVAAAHGLTLSTLRRRLLALWASEQVDAGAFDALWDGKADRVVFVRGGAE